MTSLVDTWPPVDGHGDAPADGGFLRGERDSRHMSEFDLDLRAVEEHIDEAEDGEDDSGGGRIVLDVLDGTTADDEWIELIQTGNVLVLNVEGDVNKLASGFAREIRDAGGDLVHFRGFLIVAPPGIDVDRERLQSD